MNATGPGLATRRHWFASTLLFALLAAPPAAPATTVALELVLAVDVSSSVDPLEYQLQMDGLAHALRDPEVRAAIGATAPEGVAMAVVQWAGGRDQRLAAGGWSLLREETDVLALADRIARTRRQFVWGQTGIGEVLAFATRQLEENAFVGVRRVIDLSGDGQANQIVPPRVARDAAVAQGLTINGLAILTSHPDLGEYYRRQVIGGPAAFVIEAASYPDFAEAMTAKLLRELRPPVAAAPEGGRRVVHAPSGPAIEDGAKGPRTFATAYQYEPMMMDAAPADHPARSPGDARP